MAEPFNPYQAWLGLSQNLDGPSHYELFGLEPYEADSVRIAQHADKAIARVRAHRPGNHAAVWAKLLDELQQAKNCLLDLSRKTSYDENLKLAEEAAKEDAAAEARAAAEAKPAPRVEKPAGPNPMYPPGMGGNLTSAQAAASGAEKIEMQDDKLPPRKDSPPYPPGYQDAPAAPAAVSQPSPQPQPYYPPTATPWQSPMQSAPMQPMQQSYQPYAAPLIQPMNYPSASGPVSYPMAYPQAGAPMALPAYSQPGVDPQTGLPMAYSGMPAAMPSPAYGYMSQPPLPPPKPSLDPMAPVAIPAAATPGAAAAPMAVPVGIAPTSIPVGTALGGAQSAERNAQPAARNTALSIAPMPLPTAASASSEASQPPVRTSSASASLITAKKEKENQQTLLIIGVGGALAVVASIIVFFALGGISNFGNGPVAQGPGQNVDQGAGKPGVTPNITSTKSGETRPTPGMTKPEAPKSTPEVVKPAAKPEQPKAAPIPETKTPVEKPATETKPEPKPETPPEPKPEPQPEPKPETPPAPKPEPKPETPPEPKPEPMPAAEMPKREDVVLLENALKHARTALGEFNFDEADAEFAKAEKLPMLPEHKEKYSRLKEVASYVKQFRDRLVEAATSMEGGETFKVGSSTIIALVEADQKHIVYRAAGQNTDKQYQDLSLGIAVALAELKLENSDPVSRVVKGAYVAVHPKTKPEQLQQARDWWDEAILGGADVRHLLPLLTESYDLVKDFDKLEKKASETAKPTETKPTETKPTEAKPGETKPVESKSDSDKPKTDAAPTE